MDKNNKMIAFVFAGALQKIFPAGADEKMNERFDRWSHPGATSEPDRRHPFQKADFQPRNPQFDTTIAKTHSTPSYILSIIEWMALLDVPTVVSSP